MTLSSQLRMLCQSPPTCSTAAFAANRMDGIKGYFYEMSRIKCVHYVYFLNCHFVYVSLSSPSGLNSFHLITNILFVFSFLMLIHFWRCQVACNSLVVVVVVRKKGRGMGMQCQVYSYNTIIGVLRTKSPGNSNRRTPASNRGDVRCRQRSPLLFPFYFASLYRCGIGRQLYP